MKWLYRGEHEQAIGITSWNSKTAKPFQEFLPCTRTDPSPPVLAYSAFLP